MKEMKLELFEKKRAIHERALWEDSISDARRFSDILYIFSRYANRFSTISFAQRAGRLYLPKGGEDQLGFQKGFGNIVPGVFQLDLDLVLLDDLVGTRVRQFMPLLSVCRFVPPGSG